MTDVAAPQEGASAVTPGAEEQAPPLAANQTRINCSRSFGDWLSTNFISLAFSSYQSGEVFLVGVLPDGRISFHQQNYVRAMGLWAESDRVFVAGINQIFRLENMLNRNERANNQYDRLLYPRAIQTTGDLDIHEMVVDRAGRLIFVNTKFSCLATPSHARSFNAVWKPDFISKIAAEDRCHLNGLGMQNGMVKYVTCVGPSDLVDGWRPHRREGGLLIDVTNHRRVSEGFSMPHSPRVMADGSIIMLDSGRGYLVRVDPQTGARENITFLRGFSRGLAIWNNYAVVTLSLPRDGSFEGLELQENLKSRGGEAWCGLQVIDLRTGDILHWVSLEGHIKELFDVSIMPGARCPMAIGVNSPDVNSLLSFEGEGTGL